MKSREEVFDALNRVSSVTALAGIQIEVLLDIRDLLITLLDREQEFNDEIFSAIAAIQEVKDERNQSNS